MVLDLHQKLIQLYRQEQMTVSEVGILNETALK
jgi:hypothetical protein